MSSERGWRVSGGEGLSLCRPVREVVFPLDISHNTGQTVLLQNCTFP